MCTISFFFALLPLLKFDTAKTCEPIPQLSSWPFPSFFFSFRISFLSHFGFNSGSSLVFIYIYILLRGLLVGNRVLELGARFPEESRRTFPHSFSLSGAAQTLKNRTDRKRRMEIGMEEEAAAAAALLLVSERKIVDRETRALGEGQEGGGRRQVLEYRQDFG